MYRFYENINIFKKRFHLSLFSPIGACTTLLRGYVSDESTSENYINNLLTLVIWKCVYDRIVYKVKNRYQYFLNKGVFKGEAHCRQGGGGTKALPPYTNALVRPCTYEFFIFANRCSRA